VSLLVILLVLILALSLLLVVPRKSRSASLRSGVRDDQIDREVLGEAEEELEGLSASARPEDADDELPDWGPGAPKHNRGRTQ
jgi:hypothetical protein